MSFSIGARRATLADIVEVARRGSRVELSSSPLVLRRIEQSRRRVVDGVRRGEVIYGVNTGVGTHAVFLLPAGQAEKFQETNLLQLCCGTGPPLEGEIVRASMFLRAVTLALGYSGVRPEVIEQLAKLLNAGITPVVPRYGSVGASGDLIPAGYIGCALLGRGQVRHRGRPVTAAKALRREGIEPLRLSYKEGLALINGTTLMTGVAALAVYDAGDVLRTFLAAAALAVEALGASVEPYEEFVQRVKGHAGQVAVASYLREMLEGSQAAGSTRSLEREIAAEKAAGASRASHALQSGYSVRCIPQGIGPMYDTLRTVEAVIETEANSANDNPLVDFATGRIYHAGNFYGGHVARAMDGLKLELANLVNWAHALMAVLVDERFSGGLPPALVARPGVNTGFKGMQLSLASLACAVRQIASPSTVHPVSTEQHNQDIVSLGAHAALTARDCCDCARDAVAILLLAACQAVDLRGAARRLGDGTSLMYRAVRRASKFVRADRAMEADIRRVSEAMASHSLPDPGWQG